MARICKRHGPKELLAIVLGEEAGVRFFPMMGLALPPLGAPSGPLGEALFWGKHVTLYISALMPDYGL